MPLIPDDKIEEVRQATDIVDVISRYLPLKRSGNSYKALCPFHREKTASFHVFPETQLFKCFGCGKGGSVFHFLMERERMTFPEAVRSLARDVGIEVGTDPARSGEAGESREGLFRVLEWACRVYEKALSAPAGEKARDYLKARKIGEETAAGFRLGYAPAGWRNLVGFARERKIPLDLLDRTGLIRTQKAEPYDWFRDRLMFPILDVRDRVIGFGARALDDSEPKYLNSPDTALFKKGRTLYALNAARESALREKRLAIVEGYTDVIMAHQHGIPWVVAGLGTGLTRDHAALAKRYAERIDLIYDADTAGARAAERALDVFLAEDADVRVVQLPDGLDPCDFLVQRGAEAFLGAVSGGKEVFEFLLERAAGKNDLDTVAGRKAAVDEVLSSVARTTNAVTRDMLLRRVAEAFRVGEGAVRERLRLFEKRGDAIETGPAFAPEEPAEVPEEPEERLVVEAVLLDDELAARLERDWPPDRFRHPVYREIATAVVETAREGGSCEPGTIAGRLTDPTAAETLTALFAGGEGKRDFERQYDDCVERLRNAARMAEARVALARARERRDEEECGKLERELFHLRNRVK